MRYITAPASRDFYLRKKLRTFFEDDNFVRASAFDARKCGEKARRTSADNDNTS